MTILKTRDFLRIDKMDKKSKRKKQSISKRTQSLPVYEMSGTDLEEDKRDTAKFSDSTKKEPRRYHALIYSYNMCASRSVPVFMRMVCELHFPRLNRMRFKRNSRVLDYISEMIKCSGNTESAGYVRLASGSGKPEDWCKVFSV